jgi:hypothetical protein
MGFSTHVGSAASTILPITRRPHIRRADTVSFAPVSWCLVRETTLEKRLSFDAVSVPCEERRSCSRR